LPQPNTPGLTPSQLNYAGSAQWRMAIRQALADTRCASPAFLVEDMNTTEQTVTVQIAIQERVRVPAGQQWWDIPPIVHVPVVLPRGGGYSITMPLKKGDEGLLVFCDTCFDNWWVNGQSNSPPAHTSATSTAVSGSQTQNEIRRHYVHDCGFIPGMHSQPNVLTNYSANSMQIRKDDDSAIIDVSASGVAVTKIGGTPLVLMNDVFYQWFIANVEPFLVSKGYVGPPVPFGAETTVLKGA
jgi:hypothetical protein